MIRNPTHTVGAVLALASAAAGLFIVGLLTRLGL
jgi:hypothetical protein